MPFFRIWSARAARRNPSFAPSHFPASERDYGRVQITIEKSYSAARGTPRVSEKLSSFVQYIPLPPFFYPSAPQRPPPCPYPYPYVSQQNPITHRVQTSGPLFCRPLFGRSRGYRWRLSAHDTICILQPTGGPSNAMRMQPVLNTFFQPLSVERRERGASKSTFLVRVILRFSSLRSFTCTAWNACRAKALCSPY